MRGLIILAAVVLVLALVGWISFSNDSGESTITLEKEEIKQDTREMLEAGDDLIDRARASTEDTDPNSTPPASTTTPRDSVR